MVEQAQWVNLTAELGSATFHDGPDGVSWKLENKGLFSTKSLYRKLSQDPILPSSAEIWKARVPLKIRIFLWQLARDRLPSKFQ